MEIGCLQELAESALRSFTLFRMTVSKPGMTDVGLLGLFCLLITHALGSQILRLSKSNKMALGVSLMRVQSIQI